MKKVGAARGGRNKTIQALCHWDKSGEFVHGEAVHPALKLMESANASRQRGPKKNEISL
jgi:hypothetical protein